MRQFQKAAPRKGQVSHRIRKAPASSRSYFSATFADGASFRDHALLMGMQESAESARRAVSSIAGLSVGIGLASLSTFAGERLQRLQKLLQLQELQHQQQVQQMQLQQLHQQEAQLPSVRTRTIRSSDSAESLARRLIRKNSTLKVSEAYTLNAPLGTGTFGVVLRATHNRTGIERAIKRIDKKLMPDPLVSQEVEALKLMDHPHVCRLIEYFETKQHLWLVTELCHGEELCDRVLATPTGLPEREVAKLTEQMFRATLHCHKQSVVHHDLKPENFLFTDSHGGSGQDELKLIDFGFAMQEGTSSSSTRPGGTLMYMSPQVLAGNRSTPKDDVWSLGVIFHILLTGEFPFSTNDDRRFQDMVDRGVLRKDLEEHLKSLKCSPQALDLAQKLLTWDDAERVSMEAALRHPFLKVSAACEFQDHLLEAEDMYRRLSQLSQSCRLRRIVAATVAQMVGESWKDGKQVKQTYVQLDKCGHGQVSTSDLDNFLHSRGLSLRAGQLADLAENLQPKGMSYGTFVAAMLDESLIPGKKELCEAVFELLDADHDGIISPEDLHKRLGLSLPESIRTIQEACRSIEDEDLMSSNFIDLDNFMLVLQPPSTAVARTNSGVEGWSISGSKAKDLLSFMQLDKLVAAS